MSLARSVFALCLEELLDSLGEVGFLGRADRWREQQPLVKEAWALAAALAYPHALQLGRLADDPSVSQWAWSAHHLVLKQALAWARGETRPPGGGPAWFLKEWDQKDSQDDGGD